MHRYYSYTITSDLKPHLLANISAPLTLTRAGGIYIWQLSLSLMAPDQRQTSGAPRHVHTAPAPGTD